MPNLSAERALSAEDPEAKALLKAALQRAKQCDNPSDAAWALRRAFDSISQRPALLRSKASKPAAAAAGVAAAVIKKGQARPATSSSPARPTAVSSTTKADLKGAASRAIQIGR